MEEYILYKNISALLVLSVNSELVLSSPTTTYYVFY